MKHSEHLLTRVPIPFLLQVTGLYQVKPGKTYRRKFLSKSPLLLQ